MQYRFLEDKKYNIGGGWNGRRSAEEGDVCPLPDELAERFLERNIVEPVTHYPSNNRKATPSENKVTTPKKRKTTYVKEHKGFGNYEILDDRGHTVVENVKGKEKAEAKLEELNG